VPDLGKPTAQMDVASAEGKAALADLEVKMAVDEWEAHQHPNPPLKTDGRGRVVFVADAAPARMRSAR
jgi:hypothetical protein